MNSFRPRNGGHNDRMTDDSSPLERFAELDDVATALALTPAEVLDLVREGHLRGVRVGSPAGWRIDLDSVDAHVDALSEDARRAALWRQSQAASFPDLWGRGRIRHDD